jgi:REP element-mobilizing transposase RayT
MHTVGAHRRAPCISCGDNIMRYDSDKYHRHSIRLQGYNYSQSGAYFITVCTYQRECLFGEIIADEMRLNSCGQIVYEEWDRTSSIRREIDLDLFIVMPNHLHAIVVIDNVEKSGAPRRAPLQTPYRPPKSLGSLVAGFKSVVTKRINLLRDTPETPVWQRNYYENIIRNEKMLTNMRQYVLSNPSN